jgi:hypothetical protein
MLALWWVSWLAGMWADLSEEERLVHVLGTL